MVKAMLNSPTADSNGYCNLFGNADFKSISAMGNNRARASEANAWMLDAEAFFESLWASNRRGNFEEAFELVASANGDGGALEECTHAT